METEEGYVQEYPCDCFKTGICWIVRHPDLSVALSYKTEHGAKTKLGQLRAKKRKALKVQE